MIKNPVTDCIDKRKSVRSFAKTPLTKEEEDTILESAMRAPTAAKLQLYSIIIVRNQETKEKLSVSCNNQPWIATSPFLLIFCADYQRIYDYYGLSGAEKKAEEYGIDYIKPGEQYLLLATVDATIAAQNAVLAGESIGVSSCYVGHIMDHYEFHKELFNLPEYVYPVLLLAMGKPKSTPEKKTPRSPREYVVFEEKYKRFALPELEKCYYHFPSLVVPNKFNAENKGQLHYLSRHSHSACYWEGIRSVREALKSWSYKK